MAIILKITRTGDSDFNLHSAGGAGARVQKWYPKIAELTYGQIPPYLTEEMDVLVDRDTDDNLAATVQALDRYAKKADRFCRDRTCRYPVWLYAKMDDETYVRRALVRAIKGNWRSDEIAVSGYAEASNALFRLQVERHPFWEETNEIVYGESHSNTTGVSHVIQWIRPAINTDYVRGDVRARTQIRCYPTSEVTLDRLWAGIRSDKHGDPEKFINLWEYEDTDTVAGTDCTAPEGDATASPGGGGNTRRRVTFATATWALRHTMELEDFTTDYWDNVGRFLWLGRYKTDSATEIEVKLRFSTGGPGHIEGPTISITNTAWNVFEMGECSIPTLNVQGYGVYTQYLPQHFTIETWARRISGTGDLYLDCLAPIPTDEGWLKATGMGATSASNFFLWYQTEQDDEVAWTGRDDIEGVSTEVNADSWNFGPPPGTPWTVVATARESTQVIADVWVWKCYWWPRWRNLRGDEWKE